MMEYMGKNCEGLFQFLELYFCSFMKCMFGLGSFIHWQEGQKKETSLLCKSPPFGEEIE